jgi:hypothetical protein
MCSFQKLKMFEGAHNLVMGSTPIKSVRNFPYHHDSQSGLGIRETNYPMRVSVYITPIFEHPVAFIHSQGAETREVNYVTRTRKQLEE